MSDDVDLYPPPGEWRLRGACVGTPVAWWFPRRGDPTAHLKRICAGCPVRQECADYALPLAGLRGAWGGLSEKERRRARAKLTPARLPAECGTPAGYTRHFRDGTPMCEACREADSAARRARRLEVAS